MTPWPGVPEPEVILEMEAAGQASFVDGITLPIEVQARYLDSEQRFQSQAEAEAEIEALGILLGAPIDGTFRNAVLPPGWTKRPAPDHSMWNYVYDESGAERLAIFFKAAPYDYRAFMRVSS